MAHFDFTKTLNSSLTRDIFCVNEIIVAESWGLITQPTVHGKSLKSYSSQPYLNSMKGSKLHGVKILASICMELESVATLTEVCFECEAVCLSCTNSDIKLEKFRWIIVYPVFARNTAMYLFRYY